MQRENIKENTRAITRSNRTFKEEGGWYFKTREGDLAGPFEDELEASTRLEVYIRLVNSGLQPLAGVLSR